MLSVVCLCDVCALWRACVNFVFMWSLCFVKYVHEVRVLSCVCLCDVCGGLCVFMLYVYVCVGGVCVYVCVCVCVCVFI